MNLSESSKMVMTNALKEWAKFSTEREKMTTAVNELSAITRKVVQECLVYFKSQNKTQDIGIQCDSPDDMRIFGLSIHVDPVIEATFPTLKASVVLKCSGSTRAILLHPNLSVSAGGTVVKFEDMKKGIPDAFVTNAAEFVSDSFLFIARTGGKEE
jgi:hypothetical protein